MTNAAGQQPTPDQIRTLREMWRHEDILLSNRVTWVAVFNSFLVGGFAAASGKDNAHAILTGISVCGLVVSLSAGISLLFSHKALNKLSGLWRTWFPAVAQEPVPPLMGYEFAGCVDRTLGWFLPWRVLPIVGVLGWGLVLAYVLYTR